jgi:hypothetical protein
MPQSDELGVALVAFIPGNPHHDTALSGIERVLNWNL